jgi:hypothetical protein
MQEEMSSEPIPLYGLRPLIAALNSLAQIRDIDKKPEYANKGKYLAENMDHKWIKCDKGMMLDSVTM